MTRQPHLLHVTLSTGHVRRSPRSEVGDDVVRALKPLLERALRGDCVAVPGQPGFTMSGSQHGQCCVITLWTSSPTGGARRPNLMPVLTIGVAPHSRCGAHLWRRLHERKDLKFATDPDDVPPEPWVADRLEPGAGFVLDALSWTGDLSRCLGWTWIAMRTKK